MSDTIDLLQIKIEKAKRELSDATLNAISAVPWQATILKMRETKGYSFEQLEDLETETELLFCGLSAPENYPKELEKRLKISAGAANELVNYMNQEVFLKIKDELIKNIERKEDFAKKQTLGKPKESLLKNSIKIISGANKPDLTIPELPAGEEDRAITYGTPHLGEQKETEIYPVRSPEGSQGDLASNGIHPLMAQKLVTPVQIPSVKTEHTLDNITKTNGGSIDPYREIPE